MPAEPRAAMTALLLPLLLREHHRTDPVVVALAARSLPDGERPLVLAAGALLAGEPKRAARALEGMAAPAVGGSADDAAALRHLATVLDRNWFPGDVGAVLRAEDIAAIVATAVREPAGRTPVGHVATRLLPGLLSLRASAAAASAGPGAERLAAELPALAEQLRAPGDPSAYWGVAVADLLRSIGDTEGATALLAEAAALAGVDPAARAHAAVVEGDWHAEPRGRPGMLGLDALPVPPSSGPGRDLDRAAERYEQAARWWTEVGSQSGVAVASLRLAHVARLRGDAATRDALRARAETLATAAGSGALTLLAQLHGLVDRLAEGEVADPTWAGRAGVWAVSDGSTSYARGLVRLLAAQVRRWRADGAFLRARRGLRVAEELAAVVGAETEVGLVAADVADQYAEVYRPAGIVAADQRLAALLAGLGDGPVEGLTFLTAADRAMTIFGAANRGAHARLVAVAADRLRQLLARVPRVTGLDEEMTRGVVGALEAALAQAETLEHWYRGLELRAAGYPEDAVPALEAALTRARAAGDRLVECAVLVALRRPDDALALARELDASGALSPELAAHLYVRLRSADDATRARSAAAPADAATSWTSLAHDAELHLLRGEPAHAAWLSEEALRLFGDRLGRLGRDVLRTASTDVPELADAQHVAVLAHLDLAAAARSAGDDSGALSHELQALAVADQARGIALVARDAAGAVTDESARRAVRAWLRAGSAWAATFEDLAAALARGDAPAWEDGSARVLAAERELDAAEEEVERRAPAVLADRSPARLDIGAVSAAVPADGLLLAYHAHRHELVGWAVTRSSVRVVRQPCDADDLTARTVRAHRALSGQVTGEDGTAGLAATLLAPFADEIRAARRVLVAPHGALSVLPFHALPWDGAYLGTLHDVSFLPTVGLLARPDAGRLPRLDRALLVGDPAADPARGLPRLPGTHVEVAAVSAALTGAEVLLGPAATEEAVTRLVPGRSVLHVAAHGVIEAESPNSSLVVLADGDSLTVADLMALDVGGDLVVLSACQTGQGVPTAAGDVIGLARAALVAGARHVVVSLWPVDDHAGALVMTGFYRRLVAGDGVAAALAAAQREVGALDAAGRAAAYAALAAQVSGAASVALAAPSVPRARRGFVLPEEPAGGSPYFWAPFVHIGV